MNGKIFILDDNEEFAVILKNALIGELHLPIEYCFNSVRALKLLSENEFDYLVFDVDMPEMSGYDLLGSLHAIQSPNIKKPICMLSGNHEARQVSLKFLGGLNSVYFVNKDINYFKMVREITRFFRSFSQPAVAQAR